jgi:site-specific recombinase XerD
MREPTWLVEMPPEGRRDLAKRDAIVLPAVVAAAGERASERFVEFFTASIRNPNTRKAYARAVERFMAWVEDRGLTLEQIRPVVVAAYVEQLQRDLAAPSVKLHLAGITMLFNYLVTGGILVYNPASPVRGPNYTVKVGKTPVLSAEECRALLDSIDTSTVVGLRDRALIGVMTYSFARVGRSSR